MPKLLSFFSFVLILAGGIDVYAEGPVCSKETSCGVGETCCQISDKSWGCCPPGQVCVAKGGCCPQNYHYCSPDNCCPPGYTCYGKNNEFCIKGSKEKEAERQNIIPAVKVEHTTPSLMKSE